MAEVVWQAFARGEEPGLRIKILVEKVQKDPLTYEQLNSLRFRLESMALEVADAMQEVAE